MAKKATATMPVGMFSVAAHRNAVCREIHQRGRPETILRVASAAGEVLRELTLAEGSAGHFLDPQGRALVYLSDGARGETGVIHRLRRVELASGTTGDFGPVNAVLMCSVVAVGEVRVAFFRNRTLLVATHDGRTVLEHPVPALGEAYAGALCEHGHLVAFSSGASGAQRIIDATILDLRSGAATLAIRQPDTPFSSKSALDAALSFVRKPPRRAGLLRETIGLRSHQRAGHRRTLRAGAARSCRRPGDDPSPSQVSRMPRSTPPANGWLSPFAPAMRRSMPSPPAASVLRQRINVNPKAHKLVRFHGDALLFFDATGERARLALST